MRSFDELVISAYFVFLAVIQIRVSNDVVFIFIMLKFTGKLIGTHLSCHPQQGLFSVVSIVLGSKGSSK